MKFVSKILLKIFSHKTLALIRWDLHFIKLEILNFILLKKFLIKKEIKKNSALELYLNLGSGSAGIDSINWINIDGFKNRNVNYCFNINKKLPFNNNSFNGIFCEHVLEHFDLVDSLKILKECFRVMKDGACLRLIVPDGRKIVNTYLNNPFELLEKRYALSNCAMESVNSYFRQRYEHQIAFDEELLKHQILLAGFRSILRVDFKIGKNSINIILDNEIYKWESLYVEAIK